jgi:hypothetical protein
VDDTLVFVGTPQGPTPQTAAAALLLMVSPTPTPTDGQQDEEHHRLADGRFVHASVWVLRPDTPAARAFRPSSTLRWHAPLALGFERFRYTAPTMAPTSQTP